MNQDFVATTLSEPKIIYLPSTVAREIQRQQNKQTFENHHTCINVEQVSSNNDCQQPNTSPEEQNYYHHDVDSRIVSSGRRQQMSDPIPISMKSDDAYVHDERQLHLEQQQLKKRYNNATWKLYRYIMAAKVSLRKHRVQDDIPSREEDDELYTTHHSTGSNTTMSVTLGQVEQNVGLHQDQYECDCYPFDLEL